MIELISNAPGTLTCRPIGELDIASVPILKQVLTDVARTGETLTIDLVFDNFIDLSGARAILKSQEYVSGTGIATQLVGGSEAVRRMLYFVRSSRTLQHLLILRSRTLQRLLVFNSDGGS